MVVTRLSLPVLAACLLWACSLAACSTETTWGVYEDGGGGPDQSPFQTADLPGRPDGSTVDCATRAKYVYLLDNNANLLSFDPGANPPVVTKLGPLGCGAAKGDSPFSMAVDRSATAWILFRSGKLYRVDIATLKCAATPFVRGEGGFELFSQGFVSNSKGGSDETLFISGGPYFDTGPSDARLGTLDLKTLAVTQVGDVAGWPEPTGTGDAELWAYYCNTSPPRVSRVDKKTGAEASAFDLPALPANPMAWAFAFWGGDFWIFHKAGAFGTSMIYRVKRADGTLAKVMDTGITIVGAGVSTCAPVSID